ncbi:hypothetical protein GCM10023091_32770 [Ravibacter arvi]|uniref:Glycosyltransferase involved in cell wall biosynthesis n=1 Tax=Ravibacter arvi TaxID=2051041 RepID=A0ABP8M3D1_9BACT
MNLWGQNIVVFSLFRFDADIESTAYTVASKLAEHNRVFYVDNPYTLRDWWVNKNSMSFKKRRRFFSLFSREVIDTGNPNFKVVIPPLVLSLHFLPEGFLYRLLLGLNEFLIRFRIRRILRRFGVTDYIFINAFNFHYPTVARKLSPSLRVYYCLDPVAGNFDGKHGIKSEAMLVGDADLVICSSKNLYAHKLEMNPNSYLVPNAADIFHSGKATRPETAVSEALVGIPRPVIGYFGSIEHRFDFELVYKVASARPEWSFVLAGPVFAEDLAGLDKLKNVHFTGRIPYAGMPAVIKGFDVAVIPFRKDEGSAAVFPLKLFEYLGAGKPVVATDFNPDLAEYTEDMVAYCKDAASFEAAISREMETDSPERVAERTRLAAQHTWDRRVETISSLLSQTLAGRT